MREFFRESSCNLLIMFPFQHAVFDGGEQDSVEYSDLLQSSQFSSLSSSQVNSLPNNENLVNQSHSMASELGEYLDKKEPGEDCEAPAMETAEKEPEDSHSLSSDSSLSILSPSTSLQGYTEGSLGIHNPGFDKDGLEVYPESCSSSLRKDDKVSVS